MEGIEPRHVQSMLKELAIKAGFIDENLNINPLGPHALRESFGSALINRGVPDTIVDFWFGHEIGEMAEAYKRVRLDELKRLYLEKEPFIAISGGKLEEKLRAEIDDKNRQLQALVTGLATENVELKQHLKEVEEAGNEMRGRLEELERFHKAIAESEAAIGGQYR